MAAIVDLASLDVTAEIETDIVRSLLWDDKFLANFASHVSPSIFQPKFRQIVSSILGYWNQYGKPISTDALVQDISFKYGAGVTVEKMEEILAVIKDISQHPASIDFDAKIISDFVYLQRTEGALAKSVQILETARSKHDSSSLPIIEQSIARALEPIQMERPAAFFGDIDARTETRAKIASGELKIQSFPTGIAALDKLRYEGGLRIGELGMWVGSTGTGKSIALEHCAHVAMSNGYNVLFVSLELTKEVLMDRLDAMATGERIAELISHRSDVRQKVEMMKDSTPGEIKIEYIPGATLIAIKNLIEMLRRVESFKPDMLVVDYLDLVQSSRKREEKFWREQAVIARELRDLGGKYNMAVWTAAQGNRGAKAKMEEGGVITDADIADSYAKQTVADMIISINQNKRQLQGPEPKKRTLYVVKNRNGIAGEKIGILTEYSRMRFYKGGWDDDEELLDSPIFGETGKLEGGSSKKKAKK